VTSFGESGFLEECHICSTLPSEQGSRCLCYVNGKVLLIIYESGRW
jgi:hypothetical protein